MPRKRDGFVPLGDVAGAVELPGDHVLTHRAAAAPARRRFTKLDQVTQLVRASEADAELGYMARLLALCSLPRTNPANRLQYIRRNGPYTLSKGRAYRGAHMGRRLAHERPNTDSGLSGFVFLEQLRARAIGTARTSQPAPALAALGGRKVPFRPG